MSEFATRLRTLLAERRMNQSELARRLSAASGESISSAAVGKWCRGESMPTRANELAIANLLGVTNGNVIGDLPIEFAVDQKPQETDPKISRAIEDEFHDWAETAIKPPYEVRDYARVKTPYSVFRPNLLVDDEDGIVLAVDLWEGAYEYRMAGIGVAYEWQKASGGKPLFVGWVEGPRAPPDLEAMKRDGLIAGYEIATAARLMHLMPTGGSFAGLKKMILAAL